MTVTDANLFLGRLAPGHFLGGRSTLLVEPVREAMASFAKEIGLSAVEVANGVLRVANATMERAMRVISLERGFDPRDFSLVCFGGAGGMHAADLARSMAIPRVIVPKAAGILSALGMLLADVVRDYSLTVLRSTDELANGALAGAFATLEGRADEDLAGEGFAKADIELERTVDMRYVGQGFELAIAAEGDFVSAFHRAHEQRYGYADAARSTEVVNVRIRATGRTVKPDLSATTKREPRDVRDAILGEQVMIVDRGEQLVPLYDREQLHDQHRFDGPALVVEYSTTTVVPSDYSCHVDTSGNLILERSEAL
jgi:N-methylhydantoinase A